MQLKCKQFSDKARNGTRGSVPGCVRKGFIAEQSVAGGTPKDVRGHALHEKGLQRQLGVGTLVSSQERRALLVPLMNPLQTADGPVVNRGSTAGFASPPVYIGIPSFVLAQGCEEAYQACRGDGVLVCIQSASRKKECLSSCW